MAAVLDRIDQISGGTAEAVPQADAGADAVGRRAARNRVRVEVRLRPVVMKYDFARARIRRIDIAVDIGANAEMLDLYIADLDRRLSNGVQH